MRPKEKTIRDSLRDGEMTFRHAPKLWRGCTLPIQLNWQPPIKFDRKNRHLVPSDKKGVYAFMLKPLIEGAPKSAYLLYVGKTEAKEGFRSRFGQYFTKKERLDRPKIDWMFETWEEYIWFHYAPIDDANLIVPVEEALLKTCVPPFNDKFPAPISRVMRAFTKQ